MANIATLSMFLHFASTLQVAETFDCLRDDEDGDEMMDCLRDVDAMDLIRANLTCTVCGRVMAHYVLYCSYESSMWP